MCAIRIVMTKEDLKAEYLKIKQHLGHQPSWLEFKSLTSVSKRKIATIYPKNGWSNLVIDCGDQPNQFSFPKSDLNTILIQYGNLSRELGRLPVQPEWENAGLKPTVSGIEKSHKIMWSEIKFLFKEYATSKDEWRDVVDLIPDKVRVEKISGEECFVYLMKDAGKFKIGISKHAEYRERTLQSEKPTVVLIAAKKFINRRIAASFERALHESYSHKRHRGEWFNLNELEVAEIKATLDS